MSEIKSTLTDKELNDTFYRDGDLENSVVNELRAVADLATRKERRRIINWIIKYPMHRYAYDLCFDISHSEELGMFPEERESLMATKNCGEGKEVWIGDMNGLVNWGSIDSKYKWAAMDSSGAVFAYTEKPRIEGTSWEHPFFSGCFYVKNYSARWERQL